MAETAWDEDFLRILRGYLTLLPEQGELHPDAALGSLGLDSLASIQLLVALEETFDIAIPDDLLNSDTFATARSLWNVVDSLRSPARTGAADS
jgi:acyl carrier protein